MSQEYKELLIGCGNSRKKMFDTCGSKEWQGLVTLDIDKSCEPDIEWDLDRLAYYHFNDNEFDSIHAYDVLEHCGKQGDNVLFFKEFSEYWRILKPDGMLCATVPHWGGKMAFGDPGHTRIINDMTLVYLSQKEYSKQIGKTQMTDYRNIYHADFDTCLQEYSGGKFIFILKAIKGDK